MGRLIAISQSNYIPWKGYFDLIARVDEFLLLDEVQYTRRDWRNRNQIKTANGLLWLSVPVQTKGRYKQRIDETVVADPAWPRKHWAAITQAYRTSPYFASLRERWELAYRELEEVERLSDLNRRLIELACEDLGIMTPIKWSTEYPSADGATERLLALCLAAGATEYLSGPAAKSYLDVKRFEEKGVRVRWMDYAGYPEYPQLYGQFIHNVSVLDLLFNTGSRAFEFLSPKRGLRERDPSKAPHTCSAKVRSWHPK
jgi:hypothetical protein